MRQWLRPTLTRRVIWAVLIAFALVWVVLMAYLFYKVGNNESAAANHVAFTRDMGLIIEQFEGPNQAAAAAQALAARVNQNHQRMRGIGVFLLQLSGPDGTTLFTSPEAKGEILSAPPGYSERNYDGRPYRVHRVDGARWCLISADPIPSSPWLLQRLNEDLAVYMLIAFPVVLLPIWIAVASGLRPLRTFSGSIAARGPDDLAPLDLPVRHAELMPLAAAINRLLSTLRAKLAREHAFVADAAHELRTPMAVIAAQAHVLARAEGPARACAEQQLEQAVGRASHLVQQLLEMAHIDREAGMPAERLDLAELARQELALAAPAALARRMDLSLDAPDSLPFAGDVHALRSILQNLVGNAVRYVQAGGQIAVSLVRADAAVLLTVADNGPGIGVAERELVFERFYRGAGHDAAGTGLGLSIVRQASARLGGSVSVGAGLGGAGCAFVVTLPAP